MSKPEFDVVRDVVDAGSTDTAEDLTSVLQRAPAGVQPSVLTQPERAASAEPPRMVKTNRNAASVPMPLAHSPATPEYRPPSGYMDFDDGVPVYDHNGIKPTE
jgi:hypothetical protein